jgi:hypothetical protein
MGDLRALKDKAAELVGKGKLEKAAETYRAIVKSDRRDIASRHKLGELLRKLGDGDDAVAEYRQVAAAYAHEGLLIKAVAVCKVILEIDPGHQDTQRMLADLYARRQGAPASASGIRGAVPHLPPAAAPEPVEPEGAWTCGSARRRRRRGATRPGECRPSSIRPGGGRRGESAFGSSSGRPARSCAAGVEKDVVIEPTGLTDEPPRQRGRSRASALLRPRAGGLRALTGRLARWTADGGW